MYVFVYLILIYKNIWIFLFPIVSILEVFQLNHLNFKLLSFY